MARLGEILAAGGTSPDKVSEALESQVIYGGRLGTNLLEQGAVSEEALAQALSEQHGCPALWGDIGVEQRALGLLKPDPVDRLEAVPLRLDGRRLTVLLRDPRDLARIDELAFASGKEIRPVVVTESRLWGLMRRHYAVHRPMRGVEALASRLRPGPSPVAALAAGPDLMDEQEFAALYDPAGPPPAGDAFHGNLVSTEEVLAALQVDATQHVQGDGRVIHLTPAHGMEAAPLTFEEAVKELAGVGDRDAIARVVLRCARSRSRRAVLLTVRGETADGWEGLGEGLSPQGVARIRVPLDQPGIFQTVVSSRAHFLGPLQKTAPNVRFLRALGGGAPRTSFAMPILARGRVVNVLYADNGRGELVDATGVGELLILATKIAHSYEVLLSRAR